MLIDLFHKTRESSERIKHIKPKKESGHFCKVCGTQLDSVKYGKNLYVCPHCGAHARLLASTRIRQIADKNTFSELFGELQTLDPLQFKGYAEKVAQLKEKTGMEDAVVTGTCLIGGIKTCIGVMDSHFMMASMGSVVGEKLTRLFEYGAAHKLPVILVTCSGGARMQEGMFSLLQMAKVSGAAAKLAEAGQLYITVLTDPTTGGVTASFAMLGDIILAEPKATVGFAGRRVIEGTIGEKLPKTFQSAEFTLEHGFCDAIVPRGEMKQTLTSLLSLHGYPVRKVGVKNESKSNGSSIGRHSRH